MRARIARNSSPWIWALSALVTLPLFGCAPETQLVYRDRVVKEPVPTLVALDPKLTEDCPPAAVPQGALTMNVVLARLSSVEDALSLCREHMAEIRGLPPPNSNP